MPLLEQCFPCRRVLFDEQSMCAQAQSAKDVNTPGTSALAARMCASCRRRSLSGDPTDSSGEGHARRAFRRSCGGGWLHEGNLAPNMGSPLCDSASVASFLQHVPMLREHAADDTHDVCRDPTPWPAMPREPAVDDHEVLLGKNEPGLVAQGRGQAPRDAVGEVGCGRASWAPCLRTGARRSWTEEPDDGWMALGECERITPINRGASHCSHALLPER